MTTKQQQPKPKRNYRRRTTSADQAIIATLPDDFPHIPVVPESRCKLCQLFNTHPDLFHQVNRALVVGTLRQEIIDACAARGVTTSNNSLTRHKLHIMDFVAPAVQSHLELEIISRQVGTVQDGNLAVIITKLLSLAILPSLREIAHNIKSTDGKIAGRADKAVRLALEIARAASAVQTADAQRRALMDLAVEEMRVEMEQKHPEIWAQIQPILEQFLSLLNSDPQPAAETPRVLAAAEEAVL